MVLMVKSWLGWLTNDCYDGEMIANEWFRLVYEWLTVGYYDG